MTSLPLWLAIFLPVATLFLGGFMAAWTVYTYLRKQNADRDAQFQTKIDGLNKDIAQLKENFDLKLSSAVDKESKSRHDAQNATAATLATLQRGLNDALKEMASRTEVKEVEGRLTLAMGKIETKLDHVANMVPEMNATLKQLVAQMDRMARRQEGGRVTAE
ncbi:hypothetical protein [Roseomonas indoligenes]|uniref:Uncharacterized protein n=1 Tax=Roseomonas indoligenes TaxID=2820811 RepID=A0A940N0M7_9PROT|nr:hypothetical protein [Pararoseomonas indoligenes]MBP0492142.1 hypothetical protein [Pararoseomonas indoligenes]